jgi:hypothetical protein
MGASELLRMLEPAVRPIGGAAPVRALKPAQQPIEQQSFEALLDQAKEINVGDEAPGEMPVGKASKPIAAVSPLAGLSQFDRIENASLRELFNR